MEDLINRLRTVVGDNGIISGPDLAERATSYWDPSPTVAKALVRPQSTAEVSDVMRICHDAGQTVVVQGGLTGVVEGGLSGPEDLIISKLLWSKSVGGLERHMKYCESICRLNSENLDLDYLNRWVKMLGMEKEFNKLF